jgi:hypothetical protein
MSLSIPELATKIITPLSIDLAGVLYVNKTKKRGHHLFDAPLISKKEYNAYAVLPSD